MSTSSPRTTHPNPATIPHEPDSTAPESESPERGGLGMGLLLCTFLALSLTIMFDLLRSLFSR